MPLHAPKCTHNCREFRDARSIGVSNYPRQSAAIEPGALGRLVRDDTEATGATDALLKGKADSAGSSAALSTSALEPPPLRITNGRLPVNVPREVNAGHGLGAVVRGV